jgi:hypothetical protein
MRFLLLIALLATPAMADRQAVRKVVKKNLRDVHACFERDFLRGTIVTRVEVTFTIEPTGRVTKTTAKGGGAELQRCIAGVFKRMVFPTRQRLEVKYPIQICVAGS